MSASSQIPSNSSVAPTGTPLVRNSNFVLLWAAYGISAFGDHLSELAMMRELQIEHSTRQVQMQALLTFLFFVPFFAAGWLAGAIADRLPRRIVMIGADLARAAIVLALPVWVESQVRGRGETLQQSDLVTALLPVLALGLFAAFFSPARQALLPQLVRDDQLVQANSITSGLGTIAAMLSNMVGGVLASISPRLNFMTDAGTFVASALLVSGIRVRNSTQGDKEKGRQGETTGDSRQGGTQGYRKGYRDEPGAESFGKMVLQGLSYVRTHRRVMELILLASLFWTGAGIFTSMLPSVVFGRYGLGYEWVGWIRGMLAGGMLLGAILLTWLGDRIHGELVNLLALVGAGAALVGFAWAPSAIVGMVMAVLVGVTGAMLLISVNTMLQRMVPNRWRGRVFGIGDMATMAGLLAATGSLGLWTIPGLDRHVPQVLTVLGVIMGLTGLAMHAIQGERSGLGWWFQLLWRLNQFYARWWMRVERVGPCTVPAEGPVILAANHTSYVDPLLLYATGSQRVIGFLVASEYLDMPVLGRFLRNVRCIRTTRSGQDLAATREAVRRLAVGEAVGIFPKGRIERPDDAPIEPPLQPHPGIVLLALRSKAPVVPVHISGTYYNADRPVWTFLHRHRGRVRYGPAIDLSAYYGKPVDKQTREELAGLIWSRIQALGPTSESE